jgi:hypothetical protein
MRSARPSLCGCHHAYQLGKSLPMDAPGLGKCEGLIAARLGMEKRSNFIKDVTETRGGSEGFEPIRGWVPLFDAPVVLLQMIV